MSNPIRICICDSSPILRYGLKSMLEADSRIASVVETSTHEDLLNSHIQSNIDMAIVDIEDYDSLEFDSLSKFHTLRPDVKIIIFSHCNNKNQILSLLNIGIQGYHEKNAEAREIIDAVHRIHDGGTSMADCVTTALFTQMSAPAPSDSDLSKREEEVLTLIARGKTNGDIANKLYISVRTVKFHVSSIFNKLKVKNRTQAAAMWML